ncbi:DKNYY domain-containing protein [Maribacter sp. BPC-D8]|uniref:DKNYY domain-containing protein n=1 Tax=Maribacter sp. BPC-D8 TaxID=3053613 RepID=UPI002B4821A0|nr:DKNYY domain-containing protein [Maribacter sp. BPC-D8]WRI31544.1 DKNYY domain-containing protein [Maribacter sp. BPC-D8]
MKYFFSLIVSLFLLISCTTDTELNTNVTSKQLAKNKLLKVQKTEKTDSRKGIFSNHEYSSTYSYNYQCTINDNEVIWQDKGSAVPKNLLFSEDTVYINYVEKKSVPYQQAANDTIPRYKDSIVTKYDQFIDNRYFFKWFGEFYWQSVTLEEYNKKMLNGTEYSIPNDDDLKYLKNQKKGFINYEVLEDSVMYHDTYRSGTTYYLKKEAVLFKVKGADPNTFKEMTKKYAKDSLHVFHQGHKLSRRDAPTFRVLNQAQRLFTADKNGVYQKNKLIPESHGPSFKFINFQLAEDKNQMYHVAGNYSTILKGLDSKTAKVLECNTCKDRYIVDKKHVYYEGDLIKEANVNSFQVIEYEYSKDDKHIFYRNKIIKNADYNSFQILEEPIDIERVTFVMADKNYEYGNFSNNLELIIRKKE